jgi:hypothetical protein
LSQFDVVVSLNDIHVPYHDEVALKLAIAFAKDIKPHLVILHEQAYLWSHAQVLSSLRSLRVEHLFNLEKLKIQYYDDIVFRNTVLFKHGSIIRKHSGYTARGELEKEGMSGMSGHTHRLEMHFKRNRGGNYVWVESGCLCNLDPEWIDGTADWQHGVGVFTFKRGGRHFFPSYAQIINGEILWGNKLYS